MDVMLSYRRTDAAFADEIVEYLRGEQFDPWVDRQGIKPGYPWRDQLLEKLKSCDACVAVLSPKYLESEHCRMEMFVARSFGRQILPVMTEDCADALRNHEETKGLEDIFMMRMFDLKAGGLPIDRAEAFRRVAAALRRERRREGPEGTLYISYSEEGEFATELSRRLEEKGVPTWVATLDIHVGENWRDAQARAMMRASAHLIVLSEDVVKRNVLRTEILLSEARGLPTYSILPPRLNDAHQAVNDLVDSLGNSDQTYRRIADTQYFSCAAGVERAVEQLCERLTEEHAARPRRRRTRTSPTTRAV